MMNEVMSEIRPHTPRDACTRPHFVVVSDADRDVSVDRAGDLSIWPRFADHFVNFWKQHRPRGKHRSTTVHCGCVDHRAAQRRYISEFDRAKAGLLSFRGPAI